MTAVDRQIRPVLRFEGRTQANTHRWDKQGKFESSSDDGKSEDEAAKPSIFAYENQAGERVGAVNALRLHSQWTATPTTQGHFASPTFHKNRGCLFEMSKKNGTVTPQKPLKNKGFFRGCNLLKGGKNGRKERTEKGKEKPIQSMD